MKQFELVGGTLCLDFANTVHEYGAEDPKEELHGYEDLIAFGIQNKVISMRDGGLLLKEAESRPAAAGKTLASAREFRSGLYRICSAIAAGTFESSADLELLNRQIVRVLPNLRVHRKGNDLQWDWKREEKNFEKILWPVVRSAADLLTSENRRLIRECDSQTCTWLFLDHSKNGTRRWCDMKKCGNRAKWRRHYDKIKKHE